MINNFSQKELHAQSLYFKIKKNNKGYIIRIWIYRSNFVYLSHLAKF